MDLFTRRDLLRSAIVLSTFSSVPTRLRSSLDLLFNGHPANSTDVTPGVAREHLLFDFDWRFVLGSASDPAKDLGFGNSQDAFSKSGSFEFARWGFDDSSWHSLELPRDWGVELPFVHDESLQGNGYKPLGRHYPDTSVGWYRRRFDIPKEDLGRRIVVEFDGAFRTAIVFVNGYFIGRNENGYVPFRFEVSDFLNYGGRNCITVRMDTSFGDGWFYEGAGIYRHVWLLKTEAIHLARWESYIRTDFKRISATLSDSITILTKIQTGHER